MSIKLCLLFVLLVKTVTSKAAEFTSKQQDDIKEICGSVVKKMFEDLNNLRAQLQFGQYLDQDNKIKPCPDVCTEPQSQECHYLCPGKRNSYQMRLFYF